MGCWDCEGIKNLDNKFLYYYFYYDDDDVG